MKSNRLWAIGTVIIVVAVIALGWVLGISPKITEASVTAASADQIDAENLAQQQEIAVLKAEYENIDEVRDQLAEIGKSVPSSAGMPDFIRQLNTMAAENGVSVDSISGSPATVYNPASESVSPEVAKATARLGAENLILLPVTIRVTGGSAAVIEFNEDLQTGTRLFLVTGFVLQSDGDVPPADPKSKAPPAEASFSGEINGYIFVVIDPNAPVEEEELLEETPAPAPTETPAPTDSPTPDPTATVTAYRH